jgi:hypothetical protein
VWWISVKRWWGVRRGGVEGIDVGAFGIGDFWVGVGDFGFRVEVFGWSVGKAGRLRKGLW